MYGECTSPEEERTATAVVEAAYRLHARMGPGLLESVYEACMAYELQKMGHQVQRQLPVPIVYDGLPLDEGFRLDLLVNGLVVIEIKAIETTTTVHFLQVKTPHSPDATATGLSHQFQCSAYQGRNPRRHRDKPVSNLKPFVSSSLRASFPS